MTSSLDQLLAALRSTLADPPQIVVEAERELEAMRAEVIASRYHYFVVDSQTFESSCVGRCEELPGLAVFRSTEHEALAGIRNTAALMIAEMIQRGEQPPPPRGAT